MKAKPLKDRIPKYGNYNTGERIELSDEYSAIIKIIPDDCSDPPWKQCDGHGPVSDWKPFQSKRPGERVLAREHNRALFYDFAVAIRMAKRDGWDTPPYKTGTKGEQAARAAERDFEFLRSWCNGDWHYIGVCVTVYRGDNEIADDSLWEIESCGDYWREIAAEMIGSIVAKDQSERQERQYWAARGMETRGNIP